MPVRPHEDAVTKDSGAERNAAASAALATQKRLEAKAAERALWARGQRPRAALIAPAREKPASAHKRPSSQSVDLVAGLVCAAIALYYAAGLMGIFL